MGRPRLGERPQPVPDGSPRPGRGWRHPAGAQPRQLRRQRRQASTGNATPPEGGPPREADRHVPSGPGWPRDPAIRREPGNKQRVTPRGERLPARTRGRIRPPGSEPPRRAVNPTGSTLTECAPGFARAADGAVRRSGRSGCSDGDCWGLLGAAQLRPKILRSQPPPAAGSLAWPAQR